MTLVEVRFRRLSERLAGESRCLLALLRLGYTLAQADRLLSSQDGTRHGPRAAASSKHRRKATSSAIKAA